MNGVLKGFLREATELYSFVTWGQKNQPGLIQNYSHPKLPELTHFRRQSNIRFKFLRATIPIMGRQARAFGSSKLCRSARAIRHPPRAWGSLGIIPRLGISVFPGGMLRINMLHRCESAFTTFCFVRVFADLIANYRFCGYMNRDRGDIHRTYCCSISSRALGLSCRWVHRNSGKSTAPQEYFSLQW